jgi:hypothetical protein
MEIDSIMLRNYPFLRILKEEGETLARLGRSHFLHVKFLIFHDA